MQEINATVRNSVRTALLPFLEANAPIRNIEAKSMLLTQLGFTKEQFGYTDTGISRIEVLIGNEFFRLKKMGLVEQTGWVWMVVNQGLNSSKVDQPIEEPVVNQEPIQETIEESIEEPIEEAIEESIEEPVITAVIDNTRQSKLLDCVGFRNSLIESTACYGTYNKNECGGCLLSKWCMPYTEQIKAQKKIERQAKVTAKNEKDLFLDKYKDKAVEVLALIANIGEAVELKNESAKTNIPCFLTNKLIANGETYYFVINFGVISKEIYDQVKNFK